MIWLKVKKVYENSKGLEFHYDLFDHKEPWGPQVFQTTSKNWEDSVREIIRLVAADFRTRQQNVRILT
jgi:hypothetical protein